MNFVSPTGDIAKRFGGNPKTERKTALKAWQERGYLQVLAGTDRYTDEGILAAAGRDALTMFRRGKRLAREKLEREA